MYWVDQYFRGVNAGVAAAGGGYRIGVYGSGAVCAAVKGARLAQYAWLSGSTSWDGTAGYSDWNIRQARAAERFGNLSFDHDANEARNDYGGFQRAGYTSNYAATTAAAVAAVATAVPVAAATVVTSAVSSIAPPSAVASTPPPAPPAVVVASAAPAPHPLAPPTPPVTPVAMAVPLPPPSAPPAMVSVAPPPAPPVRPATAAAAEVAALAAEEPPVSGRAAARSAAVSERLHASLRPPQEAEHEKPEHEPATAHADKHGRKVLAVAVNNRAAAIPLRHAESREVEHKASTHQRPDEHGARTQIAKAGPAHAAVEHPVHRASEKGHPEKPRHERTS
jgi:hypothetical protein